MVDETRATDPAKSEDSEVGACGLGPNIRIPSFWKTDPQLWFCQAEAVFATSKVTSSRMKFQIVIANLDFEILKEVADIVKCPPSEPYEALRTRLLHTFAESENLRIRRLLEEKRLAEGERPSQLLNELKRLAGNSVSDDLLRTMWLRALPDRMQATLAVTNEASADKLADIADRIAEVYETSVHEVRTQTTSSHPSRLSQLEEMVRQLSLEIRDLKNDMARGRRDRTRSRGRTQPRERSNSGNRKWCYFHQTFREKARKCRQPCEWKSNSPTPGNH